MSPTPARRRILLLGVAVLLAALSLFVLLAAASGPSATVKLLEGKATFQVGGKGEWKALAEGATLSANTIVKTDKSSRIELLLPDGSILRLAPNARVDLKSLVAGGSDSENKASFKLTTGKLWANVSKAVGNERKFEVATGNAVAGVRGTIFRVDTLENEASLVRVYAGSVAVNSTKAPRPSTDPKAGRHEVAGPKEVSLKEYEEKLAKAMQEVRVASDGAMKLAEFAPDSEANDSWVAWNMERDKVAGIEHSPTP